MSAHSLHLVRLDIAHDHEAPVSRMYEEEHLPPILTVPGVRRITRYRQSAPTAPRYMTAVELDSPAVMESAAWRTAVDLGRWPREGRPHAMNRQVAMYSWVGGGPALTHRTPFVFWVMMDVEPHREALFNELYGPYTYNKRFIVAERIWPRG